MLPAGVIEIAAEGARQYDKTLPPPPLLGEGDPTAHGSLRGSFGHAPHDDGQVSYHTPRVNYAMLIQRQPLPDDDGAIILVQDVSRALEMQQQLAQ